MHVCICIYTCVSVYSESRKDIGELGTRVTGACMSFDMGVGSQIQVFWKSSNTLKYCAISYPSV